MGITRNDIDSALNQARQNKIRVTLRDVDGSGQRDAPEPGLTLIIGPTGAGRWSYAYRPRGRRSDGRRHPQKWVRVGGVHSMDIEEARGIVRRIKERVAEGGDPLEERRRAERAERKMQEAEAARNMALGEAIERYIDQKRQTSVHVDTERRQLKLGTAETGIQDPRIDDITKHHVLDLIERHRFRPATARQRYGAMNRLYKWLLARDLVSVNPCSSIDTLPPPPPPRTWKPTASELCELWQAAGEIGGSRERFFKAMTLVPLRLNEMAQLSPREVENGHIVLHGKRTKNGDDFSIPVPSGYLSLFEPDNETRVFQLAVKGDFNARKSVVGRFRKLSGVERFHFHSLRKLFLSELAEHDIGDPDLADSLLNHRQSETRSGVRAAYLQARRRRKKIEVMEAWARLVDHAVTTGRWPRENSDYDDNVIGLRW
ncbi:tyrosine-type recombinase/integrase [Ruegeria lacuscaerulensis]|uniref:tyrosine-type recombinase/integrase n=1 Tax=Ruegeria lacuscaerulensis TaxID=55218 RepID=UPI00147C1BDD|nr:integrase family protein [Ruegeria lacuscaerulensis]